MGKPHQSPKISCDQTSLSSLPTYSEAMDQSPKQTGNKEFTKKKIIPVHSDIESSPSPDNPSPLASEPQQFQSYQQNIYGDSQRKSMSTGLKNMSNQNDQDITQKTKTRQHSIDSTHSRHSRT